MKIQIQDRLRPFSHSPGHAVILPKTNLTLKAYPSALLLYENEKSYLEFVIKGLTGPLKGFTVQQDLEACKVYIYGEAKEGYFRLSIQARSNSAWLIFEKTPPKGIFVSDTLYQSGDQLELKSHIVMKDLNQPQRLFLGSSKKKEAESIRKRKDLKEILPLWHRLGCLTPFQKPMPFQNHLQEVIKKNQPQKVYDLLYEVYLGHLSSGLVPRAEDEEKQGLSTFEGIDSGLLPVGADCIESLFFLETPGTFEILPCLLPSFVSGKFIGLETQNGCKIQFEWTKSKLRRLVIESNVDQSLELIFPSYVKSFRLRKALRGDKGRVIDVSDAEIRINRNKAIYLDLFKK